MLFSTLGWPTVARQWTSISPVARRHLVLRGEFLQESRHSPGTEVEQLARAGHGQFGVDVVSLHARSCYHTMAYHPVDATDRATPMMRWQRATYRVSATHTHRLATVRPGRPHHGTGWELVEPTFLRWHEAPWPT